MLDAQSARGPDGRGVHLTDGGWAGLGHVRLAIIDPTAAADQPFATPDGRFHITYNGEVYNYRQLRAELVAQGVRLRTHSDTEVIIEMYRRDGPSMLSRLRGMFAFAILDREQEELFLARDPLGIKPLYYADTADGFVFASQVKALLAAGVSREPDPAGHVGFMLWGSVPEPHTMFAAVRALPAGSWLRVTRCGAGRPTHWYVLADVASEAASHSTDGNTSLRSVLANSVQAHLEADVEIGVFLSAGIDSSAIAFHATEMAKGDPVRTFTLGFQEYEGTSQDETELAEMIAAAAGTRHTATRLSDRDFEEQFDHLLESMDQPSIDGVNTYFVSREVQKAGIKVALSGIGGDEVFGGYGSFRRVPRSVAVAGRVPGSGFVGRRIRSLAAPVIPSGVSPKWAGVLEYGGTWTGAYLLQRGLFMPWEMEGILGPDLAERGLGVLSAEWEARESVVGSIDKELRVSVLEIEGYMRNQLLRDADWAGMANSVEVRVPYVDVDVIAGVFSAALNGHRFGKNDIATSPRRPMPAWLLTRPKTGFSIPAPDWAHQLVGVEPTMRSWATYLADRYTHAIR